jgi:hypothetical protein
MLMKELGVFTLVEVILEAIVVVVATIEQRVQK